MGKFDARLIELRRMLEPRGVPRPDDVMVKLKLAIDLWAEKREKLLIDLADRTLWAHVRTDPLAENWKRLIKAARADVAYHFGTSTLTVVMDPLLLREWLSTMRQEDRFLEMLHDLPTPGMMEEMTKYQVGMNLLITELDQKWSALVQSKSDFRTPEQLAIAEADRIVMDVLDKHETAAREILKAAGDTHIVVTKYVDALKKKIRATVGEVGAKIVESEITKSIIKIFTDDKISPAAKDGLKAASAGFNYAISYLASGAREYLKRVDTYRYTLRYEGAILQIFKANREKVAAYERDNNLSKTNDVRARAIAAVMQWAQAQPTDAMKYDATLFATDVASSLQAAYDRSKGMDDSFRSKFNGLFTGPLSDGNLEILSERYVYEQQLGGLKGRGGDRKLLATADQLKSNLSAELDKSIVPLTTAAAEFPREAGEILLLHAKEFREILAQEVDAQLRELIKASLELSQKLSAQGISQDFDRGEIINALR